MHAVRTDDVIAAVSSPPGRGVRGIVRLTGPEAVALADATFQATDGRPLAEQPAWRLLHGFAHIEQDLAVPANAVVFLPPKSYTGQPLVELHLAGSPALLEMALRAAIRAGARLAEPGEFTARAFLAGRMDLLAAEAVAQTIAARSDAQLAASRELGSGRLATFIRAATDELADLLSLLEAGIDFADEAIEFIDAATLAARLAALRAQVADLQARALDVRRLETLPRVALVGPANAGKSSLLNRLSGLDRSICSPIPGTTRDMLAAVMDTPAGQVTLLDGPGVGPPRDALDELAQRQWRALLEQVDLVVLVLPADALSVGSPPTGAGSVDVEGSLAAIAGRECLVALNKQDLLSADCQAAVLQWADGRWPGRTRLTSAITGFGCEDLREAVAGAVGATPGVGEGRIVLTARHSQALADALAALDAALEMADRAAGQSELVALHLREALEALGSITGQVTTEDLLGRVFAGFCIGK